MPRCNFYKSLPLLYPCPEGLADGTIPSVNAPWPFLLGKSGERFLKKGAERRRRNLSAPSGPGGCVVLAGAGGCNFCSENLQSAYENLLLLLKRGSRTPPCNASIVALHLPRSQRCDSLRDGHRLYAGFNLKRYGFSCAVSRLNPHGQRWVFRSNLCEPYRLHFLNCLGLPPNLPFSALAACLAGVLASPPTRPPRRPNSAAAFDNVESCMLYVITQSVLACQGDLSPLPATNRTKM